MTKNTLEAAPENNAEPAATDTARPKNVIVTFLRPFTRYVRGDIAGFQPAEAERLIQKRVAVKGTQLPKEPETDKEPKA
ncbi:hypothetical protein MIH18_23765 (plasmid) [Marinobacter sp. M3C]|jgi:hypothetical protein|uniref:hypothetical protein n=1 Tax=Marinobacter sp. M3C TaxID=2917715 RepID=UPI00200D4EA3|nr:hypothetical protein [Marinobacter sp. M3C]MCL1485197.1 hypothetical protein [Marinobacter sp.]UQG62779.1 hypothetical protein MIH18_23765 [Marinobacter sp. M3C]